MSFNQGDSNPNWSFDMADLHNFDDAEASPQTEERNENENIHIENSASSDGEDAWNLAITELFAIDLTIDLIDDEDSAVREEAAMGDWSQDIVAGGWDTWDNNDGNTDEPYDHADSLYDYDLSEDNDGDNSDNLLENPWGLTDEEVEALRAEQDRVFGDVPDQDIEPLFYTCVCGDTSPDVNKFIHLTCPDECVRCMECLNNNVSVGLESRKNYPPTCCVPIELNNVASYLDADLVERWLEVGPEYSEKTPTYCAVSKCSAYLPSSTFIDEDKWALCPRCDVKTCLNCLSLEADHENTDACPPPLSKENAELASREGWKACPQCWELIEKTDGCNHMTCECGEEFCYACGTALRASMPCNCNGENQWVEQVAEDAGPERQQEMWDEIVGENDNRGWETQQDEEIEGIAEDDEIPGGNDTVDDEVLDDNGTGHVEGIW